MTVNEYRKKHKRCRTCVHAFSGNVSWYCKAKNARSIRSLEYEGVKGMFCRLYKAKEIDNG